MFLLVELSLAAGIVILGQAAEARRQPLTEADRASAPGYFRHLRHGRTHVQWSGAETGRIVVAVHGLTTPSAVWGPLSEKLAAQGVRLLRYDLYGRGLSDRPARRHTAALYIQQLVDVLDAEGITAPVPVIGFSMGGAVVTAFADQEPDRCSGIALLAPGGLKHGLDGLYAVSARVPGVGDGLWSVFAPGMLLRGTSERGSEGLPELRDILTGEVSRRGTLPSHLSSLRHILREQMDARHRRLSDRALPVLAIWGALDRTIPLVSRDRLAAANPSARQIVLTDAEHGLPYSHAEDVADEVVRWLTEMCPES